MQFFRASRLSQLSHFLYVVLDWIWGTKSFEQDKNQNLSSQDGRPISKSLSCSQLVYVQDTGVSFMVTPPKGGAFTPNKTLLMNRERRMNMMTPNRADKIFNTDIETGKVINEWGFKKDGIDVEMLVPPPPPRAGPGCHADCRFVQYWICQSSQSKASRLINPEGLSIVKAHMHWPQLPTNCQV